MEQFTGEVIGLIYLWTNLKNGKKYVGKATNVTLDEKYEWYVKQVSKTDTTSNRIIYRALLKHGFDNFKFEQIDRADTNEELNEKEIYWISELKTLTTQNGYNLTAGGDGGLNFVPFVREKISKGVSEHWATPDSSYRKAMERRLNANGGILMPLSDEQFKDRTKKIVESKTKNGTLHASHVCTEEHKQLMSEIMKEKYATGELTVSDERKEISRQNMIALNKSRKGVEKTDEHKRKIGESNKGKTRDEEARKKISDKNKQRFADPAQREAQSKRIKAYYERKRLEKLAASV